MKKLLLAVLMIFMSILPTSCSKQKGVDFKNMDNKTFLNRLDLPDHLHLDIDLDKMKNHKKAYIYKADYTEFDKGKLIDGFLKNKMAEEKIYAEGPQEVATSGNVTETLSIYDGGKSYGTETGMKGGFNYTVSIGDTVWSKYDLVTNPEFGMGGESDEEYRQNNDYSSHQDLDFMSYQEVLKNVEKTFQKAAMPLFDVDEAYSLDLETMKTHYGLYLKSDDMDEEMRNIHWEKEDEGYLLSLRQVVDDIPIVNKTWQMPEGAKGSAWGNPMPSTSIYLIYNKDGINMLAANTILDIKEKKENKNLISIYEALKTLTDSFTLTILEDDIHIVSADLCYLILPKGDTMELVPGWLFVSTKENESEHGKFIQYKNDVVNAINGKLYQDRWES